MLSKNSLLIYLTLLFIIVSTLSFEARDISAQGENTFGAKTTFQIGISMETPPGYIKYDDTPSYLSFLYTRPDVELPILVEIKVLPKGKFTPEFFRDFLTTKPIPGKDNQWEFKFKSDTTVNGEISPYLVYQYYDDSVSAILTEMLVIVPSEEIFYAITYSAVQSDYKRHIGTFSELLNSIEIKNDSMMQGSDSLGLPNTQDSYNLPNTQDSYNLPNTQDSYSLPNTENSLDHSFGLK
jgi:hypothetical protein